MAVVMAAAVGAAVAVVVAVADCDEDRVTTHSGCVYGASIDCSQPTQKCARACGHVEQNEYYTHTPAPWPTNAQTIERARQFAQWDYGVLVVRDTCIFIQYSWAFIHRNDDGDDNDAVAVPGGRERAPVCVGLLVHRPARRYRSGRDELSREPTAPPDALGAVV